MTGSVQVRPDDVEVSAAVASTRRRQRLSNTQRYILRRIGIFFLTIWAALTLSFFFIRLIPGDPIRALLLQLERQGQYGGIDASESVASYYRTQFGLDGSLLEQYLRYMQRLVLHFDFGPSLLSFPNPSADLILRGLPWTVGLVTVSTLLAWIIGVVAGSLVGWTRGSRVARIITNVCLATSNIPAYLFALWFVFLFAYQLGWFPSNGAYDASLRPGWTFEFIGSVIRYGTLPVLSSALITSTAWLIGTRALVVNTLGEDFLTYAEARGLTRRQILFGYVIRNSWLPQIQALGLALGSVVGGNILIEQLFRYPGVGQLLIRAAEVKDVNTMMAVTTMLIVMVLTANLLIDLLLPLLDPRVTYEKK